MTVTAVALKVTSHPASHSCPMERRVWDAKSGTMCTWRAAGGRCGISNSAVWVEYMIVPLGLWMAIGWVAGCLLTTGSVVVPKWAVLPVSAMMDVMGGPVEISRLVEETG